MADLQGGFQHRVTLMDANYRDAMRGQHAEFMAAMERHGAEIQQRLWADLERIRLEYERLIHSELRTIRQRARGAGIRTAPRTSAAPIRAARRSQRCQFDYGRFAERFRGTEEYVKAAQADLSSRISAGCRNVLDIGCGRGEFLELMREPAWPRAASI